MSNAPWREQISLGTSNERSVPEFMNSYPEYAGLGKIARGEIVTLAEQPRKRFFFLVNPSDIQSQYGMSEALDITNPDFLVGADASLISDGLNSISFSILLDRTYEVHRQSPRYRGGVLHDVKALEQVAGVPESITQQIRFPYPGAREGIETAARAWATPRVDEGNTLQALDGLLTKKFLRVLFGERDAFSFDGYINNMSVHYTHFTHLMVPTRAGVTISMTSLGDKEFGGPTRSSGASSEWSNPNIPPNAQ